MAQVTLPRMWRDTERLGPPPAARAPATAPAKSEPRTTWTAPYVHLAFWTLVAVGYVAVCGIVSELDAVRYRLLQEIAVERAHQARAVREINARASYDNLRPAMEAHRLTLTPAEVLRVEAPHALPAEVSTVLLTPQPYSTYTSQPAPSAPTSPEPTSAGMGEQP